MVLLVTSHTQNTSLNNYIKLITTAVISFKDATMRRHTREIYTVLLTDNLSDNQSVLLIRSHRDSCYRGDAAIVVLRLDVHVDERGAVVPLLPSPPHPPSPPSSCRLQTSQSDRTSTFNMIL